MYLYYSRYILDFVNTVKQITLALLLLTTIGVKAACPGITLEIGGGYQWHSPNELNRSLSLITKKVHDLNMGDNNFAMGTFHNSERFTTAAFISFAYLRLGLQVDYWYQSFSQRDIFFSDDNTTTYTQTRCSSSNTVTSGGGTFNACINAQQSYSFFPIWSVVHAVYNPIKHLSLSAGGGLGILTGSNTITIKEHVFPNDGSESQSNNLSFSLDPGINPIYKLESSILLTPFKRVGFKIAGGYQWILLKEFVTSETSGDSQVFTLANGTAIEDDQTLYIKKYSGLSSDFDDFSILKEPGTGSSIFNTVEGDFSGAFINATIVLSL